MNKKHIEISLAKKLAIVEEKGSSKDVLDFNIIKAIQTDIAQLGYTLSDKAISVLNSYSLEEITDFHSNLVECLKDMVGANVSYAPLFKGFPNDIPNDTEYFIDRIVGFIENVFGLTPEDYNVLDCGHTINTKLFDLEKFGACPICQMQTSQTSKEASYIELKDITPFKVINTITTKEFYQIFTDLVASKASLSLQDKEFLESFIEIDGKNIANHLPEKIVLKENVASISAFFTKHVDANFTFDIIKNNVKTATDVLRIAVGISGGDVSLKITPDSKYRFKLSNSQRKLVMKLLNSINNPIEDMLRYKNRWIILGKHLHIGSKKDKYPNAFEVIDTIRNNKKIATFNSEVEKNLTFIACNTDEVKYKKPKKVKQVKKEKFIPKEVEPLETALSAELKKLLGTISTPVEEKKNTKKDEVKIKAPKKTVHLNTVSEKASENEIQDSIIKATDLLSKRAGEFSRKLDFLLRHANEENQAYIISKYNKIINKVKTPDLLNLRSYFNSRNDKMEFRSYIPKGNVAKVQFVDDNRKSISVSVCNNISHIIEHELINRFSNKEEMGKVYINPELENYLVPFSQRNATKSLDTVVRGSRIKLEKTDESNIYRLFLYWKENEKSGRVDIDLSAIALDENFNYKTTVSYYNYNNETTCQSAYSGDVQSAPNGASEFIDIDCESFKQGGCRYIIMNVNSFTGQHFNTFECFAGVMERDALYDGDSEREVSGEPYEPTTVKNKFDITGESRVNIPLIFDVVKKEIIWADFSSTGHVCYNNAANNSLSIVKLCKLTEALIRQKTNIFDLFKLHAVARAEIVDFEKDPEIEYDYSFDIDKSRDLNDIAANWID